MAENVENKDENILLGNVEETYTKAEKYIEDNKKSLSIIIGAIVVIVGGYFAFKKLYLAPKELEAQDDMFVAEQYFEKDSLDKAINGDGNFLGFKQIVDDYGFTKSANLAHYYLGMSYLKKGQFENSIEELKQFDSEDEILGPLATGAIGDANMELGKTDEAIEFYLKAAKQKTNKFTSPIFLMKAGLAYEEAKNYASALQIYEQIKNDYSDTNEGRNVGKYIARAKNLVNG